MALPAGIQYIRYVEARLSTHKPALDEFHHLCRAYGHDKIDETAFYTGVYKLHLANNSLGLLPSFFELLPAEWETADLTKLNAAIEAEWMSEMGVRQSIEPPEQKKKIPINGFKTSPWAATPLPTPLPPSYSPLTPPTRRADSVMEEEDEEKQ